MSICRQGRHHSTPPVGQHRTRNCSQQGFGPTVQVLSERCRQHCTECQPCGQSYCLENGAEDAGPRVGRRVPITALTGNPRSPLPCMPAWGGRVRREAGGTCGRMPAESLAQCSRIAPAHVPSWSTVSSFSFRDQRPRNLLQNAVSSALRGKKWRTGY